MLSIKLIGSSKQEVGYYSDLGEDYYVDGGELPGIWWGEGADQLGLAGTVQSSTFRNILEGRSADGKKALVQNAGRPNRRAAFDLTFSVPKSVSIARATADEQLAKQIDRACDAASKKAFEAVQELCGFTRRGGAGMRSEPGKLVAAVFRHETARGLQGNVPDPNLHYHMVLCNLAVREDGSTGTFDARMLFRRQMKMALGALFRTELSRQLELIGLDTHRPENDRGRPVSWFELTSVPKKVIHAFSKRREQIVEWLKKHGQSGAKAAERAALSTRQIKSHFSRGDLRNAWRALAKKLGLNSKRLTEYSVARFPPASHQENDAAPFLKRIGTTCPIFSVNPFAPPAKSVIAVVWDIAADINSAARALNLAACLIPAEKGGNNQYFTDSARQVLSAIVESLIRHSPDSWSFSQFVHVTLSLERVKETLNRDEQGRETLANFFGDDRTGYQVFSTIVSRMSYYRPVAELWKQRKQKLSLRDWLRTDSVLLLGTNATVETALSAINEVMFRVLVEEVDMQTDSSTRRTWFWIDEARLSGPLLRNKMLPYLAVKGRSRGACLVLAFQDIDGFREAAGTRIANEIIAQCSHKALLRMESDESARWASRVIGQYETLDIMQSKQGGFLGKGSLSEQATKRDAVMPSEFFLIPPTTPRNGLTGYFLSTSCGVVGANISSRIVASVAQ